THIPKSLQDIINKALEKEQCMRYQSAQEMIDDLKRALIEPDGDFVVKNISSDMPTQSITPIDLPVVKNNDVEEDEKIEPISKKKVIITIMPMILILFFLIFMGVSIYKNNFVVKEVEVPDIRELSLDEATNILQDS